MAHCPEADVQEKHTWSADQQCSSRRNTWPELPRQEKEGTCPAGASCCRADSCAARKTGSPKRLPHLWVVLEQWWWVEGPAQQPCEYSAAADIPRKDSTG